MRTFICFAALVALSLAPVCASAQTTKPPRLLNSTSDFSIAKPDVPEGCIWNIGYANGNKVGYATCTSKDAYTNGFQLGKNMTDSCKPMPNNGVDCEISEKK